MFLRIETSAVSTEVARKRLMLSLLSFPSPMTNPFRFSKSSHSVAFEVGARMETSMDLLEIVDQALSSVRTGQFIAARVQLKQLRANYLNQYGQGGRYNAFLSLLQAQSDGVEHIITAKMSAKKPQDDGAGDNPIVILPSANDVCRFSSIIGYHDVKEKLLENIVLPLTMKEELRQRIYVGVRANCGNMLLHGPPGTGKTLLAKAVANECNAALFSIRPSEMLSKYQGESEKYLKCLFEVTRKHEKAIIFFDEFDSIAMSRGSTDEGGGIQARRLISELLLQLTHHKELQSTSSMNIAIIASTNRLDDLDEAIVRRFSLKLYVGLPDESTRVSLIQHFLIDIENTLTASDLVRVATISYGFSGSDIESLTRDACMAPLTDIYNTLGMAHMEVGPRAVTLQDFEKSFEKMFK